MITFRKFGKKIEIPNADWKKLRARLNPHNAILRGSQYTIKKECPFCPKYHQGETYECKGCPLGVFRDGHSLGCENFFDKLISSMDFNAGDIAELSWWKEDDVSARTQLYKLQKMMDKIERLKENKQENKNDKSKA